MELLQKIIGECPEYIILFDPTGRILQGNEMAQKGTGYLERLNNQNICTLLPLLFHMENGLLVFPAYEEAVGSSLYRENQTCFPVCVTLRRFDEPQGTVYVAYATDQTKQNELLRSEQGMREKLGEANKVRSEFVAGVTHELRTPINGIKGLADNLLDSPLTPSQVETVNIITRCSNNMTKIINDLLDFAKLESGKLSLEKREFDLHRLIRETLSFHSLRIGERGLSLKSHVAENVPIWVVGDELRLSQIMNNLFSNAIKFTSVGCISFDAAVTNQSARETELMFVVSDTGIGISEEERDRLFQKFSQVDGSITRRFGGTGLGLSICKELVEMMNGSIRFDSEKGRGSTFSFTVVLGLPERVLQEQEQEITQGEKAFPEASVGKESQSVVQQNDLIDLLDKLVLSAELGSWEKAENFAKQLKTGLLLLYPELERKAFRLELSVRGEETEKISALTEEIKAVFQKKEGQSQKEAE